MIALKPALRGITAVLVAATLFTLPVNTSSASEELCDSGDAQAVINAGPIGVVQEDSGGDTGLAGSWSRCQFRFYDLTQTFSTREWIVGGIFEYEAYDALDRPEYDRQAATRFLDQIRVQVWLGPRGESLAPVELARTGYRDVHLHRDELGHVVYNHIYFLIRPGQLSPGEYRMRFEEETPGYPTFVARGTLTVLP